MELLDGLGVPWMPGIGVWLHVIGNNNNNNKILNVAEKNRYGGLEEVGDPQNSSGLSENSLKIPNNCWEAYELPEGEGQKDG